MGFKRIVASVLGQPDPPLDLEFILHHTSSIYKTTIPRNAALNHLLVWYIFLGSFVREEALKVQDKSYDISSSRSSSCLTALFTSDHMEHILYQLSGAIVSAINRTHTQHKFIQRTLCNLIKLENRPWYLTEMSYEWCSVICRNDLSLGDWENILLVSLAIGFHRLDFQCLYISARLTNHH